jgi:hypothetical protein
MLGRNAKTQRYCQSGPIRLGGWGKMVGRNASRVRALTRSTPTSARGSARKREKEPNRQVLFLFRLDMNPVDCFHRLTGEFN